MILWVLLFLLFLPFAIVLLAGAPYLPTRKKQAESALDMLSLKKGEVFVDLGCGDGVMLVHGAKRGLVCYGYELNPLIFMIAWLRTRPYRKNVHVRMRNYWHVPLPPATKGVYVFLLDQFMEKLDAKMKKEAVKGTKLLSYTFKIQGKKAVKEVGPMTLYRY